MGRREELAEAESRAWKELHELVGRLTPEQVEEPGINADGWSTKDLLWHIGCWTAESARQLERIRVGTYEERDWDDTDDLNARYLEEGRRMDLPTVRSELTSARARALEEWSLLADPTPEAIEWFEESGAIHYGDHLGELRRYVERLDA